MNFKWWHPIGFSLVPLTLVFIGVLVGAVHGTGSAAAPRPTPVTPAPTSSVAPTPPPAGSVVLNLTAENTAFDKRSLSVPAGSNVTIHFDNKDAGVLHNFSLYTDNKATTQLFGGELTTGPVQIDYTFMAPPPGTYYFHCDVHPDQMNGSFIVR